MGWIFLLAAGLVEIAMAAALKQSEDWSRLMPSVVGVLTALLSIYLLARALRYLPLGPAYAIWTGIGTVGTAILGIALFKEPADAWRIACIVLIISGILGLKFATH